MRSIIITLFLIGIILIIIGYNKEYQKCEPKVKYVYRFVPRNFTEEQYNQQKVEDMFGTMFKNPSPWTGKFPDMVIKKGEDINKNFISQTGKDTDMNEVIIETEILN